MIITIHDSKTTASIDTLGVQLISMKDAGGKEHIWQRDPAVWSRCSPLLFPAVGNCRNGKTLFDGVWYEMPKHGFCATSEFSVSDQSETHATFQLTANKNTLRFYPYYFILTLSYRLNNGVLSMDYSVKNIGDSRMVYCIGAHPGFVCPLEEGESFEDYRLEFEQTENTASMPYNPERMEFNAESTRFHLENTRFLPLDYELFHNDAVYFDEIRSRKVSVVNPSTGKGIEVDYAGFETVAFWTPYESQAPFVCVEPWNGSAIRSDEDDEFAHRHHVQSLNPQEEKSYHLGIRIL